MAEKVEIIIEAEDNASGKIEDVGGALEVLSSTAMKENLLDLKKTAGAAFSDIGAAAGDFMKIAAEDELVMMRLDQQIANVGDTASVSKDDIIKLAEDLSKISGFDDEALIDGQTTLLRFGSLSKEQFEQATKAAADLAAMTGMSLPSAFQQVAMSLDNPENGMGRLRRMVGDLTDDQQAAIDKMIEMGDKAGAQGILLDILAGKVGGAANAYGETFTGKVGIAQTKVDNFKSSVGELINQNLPQWMFDLGIGAKEAGGTLGPVVDSLGDLGIVLMTFSKGGLLAGLGVALKGAFAGIAGIIGAISLPVLALIGAILLLIATLITLGPQAKQTLDMLWTIFKGVFDGIKFEIDTFGDKLVNLAKEKFGDVGGAIVDGIWEGIKVAWPLLIGNVGLFLANLLASAKEKLQAKSPSRVWANLGETIPLGLSEGIKNLAQVPANTASGMVSSMLPTLPPGGGGRGGAVINITYAPAVSTASPQEFEAAFVPLVSAAMRRVNRGR